MMSSDPLKFLKREVPDLVRESYKEIKTLEILENQVGRMMVKISDVNNYMSSVHDQLFSKLEGSRLVFDRLSDLQKHLESVESKTPFICINSGRIWFLHILHTM
jgi:hypothetical protein